MSKTSTMNAKLIREQLVVVIPEIRTWTGTRAMHESDYNVGTDGALPPKATVASYGLKSIIDPAVIKPFVALKGKAEAVLESSAVRFLGGWAMQKGTVADRVCAQLDAIKKEYELLKQNFLAQYDQLVEEWARKNPTFSDQIRSAKLDVSTLSRKLAADYEVISIAPAVEGTTAAEEFDRKVKTGLTDELVRSINVSARKYLKDSFNGRTEATQRILSTMRKLHSRLQSLEFLSGNIAPLTMTVATAINACPKQGMIEGANFWILRSVAQTLASEDQMNGILAGSIDCSELLVQSKKALGATATRPVVQPPVPEPKQEKEASVPDEMEAFFNAPATNPVSEPHPVDPVPEPEPQPMSEGFFF